MMAADSEYSALAKLAGFIEDKPIMHIFVDVSEPLIWLVASLFTEQFLSKVSYFSFSNTYRNYDEFYAAINAFIDGHTKAKQCLGEAHKALLDGAIQQHIRLADEWGEFHEPELPIKVRSFSFYVWAEKNEFAIPSIIMPVLRNVAYREVNTKSAFEQQQHQFPEMTCEQFFERSKEPLWNVGMGILYLLGRRSRAEGKEPEFIKYDKTAQKALKYTVDAHKVEKLNLVDCVYDSEKPETILSAKVEPLPFIEWAKGLPITFPMLSLQSPTRHPSVPSHITPEMGLMFDAIEKFWGHYDLSKPDPNKAYKKNEVVAWLKKEAQQRGFKLSNNLAKAIDTIIRCPAARQGGNTT